MATALEDRPELDRQADAIERALLGLSLPVRVNGGEVDGEWVRYHIVPVLGTAPERVCLAASAVAESIGVPEVRIAPAGRALALDVPIRKGEGPRLIPLLQAVGMLPPWTALVGMTEAGAPLVVQLCGPATDTMVAVGPAGCGKSELLRTVALSLALTTPASNLQFLGIDIGGRELAVLESLPHLAADLATTARQAGALLSRLAAEIDGDWAGGAGDRPRVLVVDDDGWLVGAEADRLPVLRRLVQAGPAVGIHVLAASREARPAWLARRPGVVVAQALHYSQGLHPTAPGRFLLRSHRDVARVRAASLTAGDLDRVRRLVQAGWAPGEPLPATEALPGGDSFAGEAGWAA